MSPKPFCDTDNVYSSNFVIETKFYLSSLLNYSRYYKK